ncbi:MAG: YSC84-related protein [Vicinamibacteria bacterium]
MLATSRLQEILTYSRTRSLFAGLSLEGSTLRPDGGANEKLYGRELSASDIVRKRMVEIPEAAKNLISALERAAPKNKSN